jgi:flagellar biosynthesis protein FlhA
MTKKKENAVAVIADENLPMSETEFYKDPQNIYSLINVELLEMEFGYSLIPLVDEKKGGSFIDRVVMLRRQFATDMGLVIPSVRLRDNIELNPNQYIIKLKGEEIARGEVLVDHFLAMNPGGADEIEGIDTVEPAFGIPAKWVTAEMRETAQMSGYTIIDPLSVIVTHLSESIKKHAYELLGQREVNGLLDNLKKTNKSIVEDLIPSVLSVSDLQKVLSNLLMEQVPIRDLTTILETAGEFAPTVKDMDLLTEYVRQSLKRTITRKFAEDGSIKVITLNPELENIILNSVKKTDHGSYVSIDPDIVQKMIASHLKEIGRLKDIVSNPVILTSPVIRVYYRKLIEQFIEDAIVLSFNEIEPSVRVQSLGTISIS